MSQQQKTTMVRRADATWVRGMQFVGTSGSGHGIVVDADRDSGGFAAGPSNTELVLIALCGCTGMDVASILRKKRVDYTDLQVEARGELTPEPPNRFTRIHVTYRVWGDVPEKALRDAIELSQEKYCTVSLSLKAAAEFSTEFEINPEPTPAGG